MELLQRLQIAAEKDYEGATLDDALDRLLREHQECMVTEAASELERNAARLAGGDQPSR